MRGGIDQLLQARECFLAIHLETAVLLRLDDDETRIRDAMVAAPHQPVLYGFGQGGSADVEAQMNRIRNLVDVLAARALRAYRANFDLSGGNG